MVDFSSFVLGKFSLAVEGAMVVSASPAMEEDGSVVVLETSERVTDLSVVIGNGSGFAEDRSAVVFEGSELDENELISVEVIDDSVTAADVSLIPVEAVVLEESFIVE